jgi:transcriptional regulator of acetoin/glycerol metabolism
MLYLSYPDYIRDEDMSNALLVDNPETYYQHRPADASPLQTETLVERGLIGLRKKTAWFWSECWSLFQRDKKGGRPKLETDPAKRKKREMSRALHADPANKIEDICKTLHISRTTLYRWVGIK